MRTNLQKNIGLSWSNGCRLLSRPLAILKSRFSKSPIDFPLVDSDVMRSSILSASSTSQFHSIASLGYCGEWDFAFECDFPTSNFCRLRPLVHNKLCGFCLFGSSIIKDCDCWRCYFNRKEVARTDEMGTANGAFELLEWTSLANVHLLPVLAVVGSKLIAVMTRLQRSVSVGIKNRACCLVPREIRTQDFEIPGCCDGTCSSITICPADLNTSIPVTGWILTWSLRTCL